MKKRLVIINRKYCDSERPSHGIVGAVVTNKTEHQLGILWEDWRAEVEFPDSDSQFIDWLVKNHGCEIPKMDWEIAVISD